MLDNFISRTYNIFIPMLVFGVPIQAIIPVFGNVPSTPINFAFRFFFAIVALVLMVLPLMFSYTSYKKFSLPVWTLLFIFFIYSIRLIYDVSVRNIKFSGGDDVFIYGYAFGNCFIPAISIILNRHKLNLPKIVNNIYVFTVAANVIVLSMILYQNEGFSSNLFLQRVSVLGIEKNLLLINTILIGLYGSALVISSYYFLLFSKRYPNWIYYTCVIIGLINLILAASRGPFFNTIILMILITILRMIIKKHVIFFLIKLFMSFILTVVLSFTLFKSVGEDVSVNDLMLFNRVLHFKEQRETNDKEERDYEWASAMRQFKENPFIGDQFVTKYDGFDFYPHNIHLEFFMSLGLVGGGCYIYLLLCQFSFFLRAIILKNIKGLLLYIYFFLFLIHVTLSGSIFMSVDFWTIFTLGLVFFTKNPYKVVPTYHLKQCSS